MIRIDMVEEPEDELDLIFKAHNINTYEKRDSIMISPNDYTDNVLKYCIPLKDNNNETKYVTQSLYKYLVDNLF